MAHRPGDTVHHPETGIPGEVLEVRRNPACLMPILVVRFSDGTVEEHEENDFGPLHD